MDLRQGWRLALRAGGADFVCAVMHANRGDAIKLQYERAAELLLTGHTHDLFINFDEKCALVESGYDAHYVTCVDVAISVREDNGKRTMTWWPQFRVIDTATVTPDPEVAAAVARFEQVLLDKMTEPIATTAVTLDSATSTVRTREAAIGNLFADAMRAGTVNSDKNLLLTLAGATGPILTVAVTPDGTQVITGSEDGTVRVWDATDPRLLQFKDRDRIASIAITPDGTRVVTNSMDKATRVWDSRTGAELKAPLIFQTAPNTFLNRG